MGKKDFTKAIEACNENGKKLCYDAESCWSSPAGVALAILAQEEFAKAFILNFVNEGIIPWTQGVQWSIRNHECKHLFVLIMDYLASIDEPFDEWQKRLKSCRDYKEIQRISSLVYEKVRNASKIDTKICLIWVLPTTRMTLKVISEDVTLPS